MEGSTVRSPLSLEIVSHTLMEDSHERKCHISPGRKSLVRDPSSPSEERMIIPELRYAFVFLPMLFSVREDLPIPAFVA